MKSVLYIIEAITNLHAGSGKANDGTVDNLVQRDAVTDLPVIHSSSLKGAFREYCKHCLPDSEVIQIFGNELKRDKRIPGNYRFFDANLLSIPVRSDRKPFLMATCPMVLKDLLLKDEFLKLGIPEKDKGMFKELSNLFAGGGNVPIVFDKNLHNAFIEEKKAVYQPLPGKNASIISLLSGQAPLVLVSDKYFKELCDNYHLPVIARNYLNDGKSENLFYEQVLPRMSRLYFVLMCPESIGDRKFSEKLQEQLVQIGANASVGYGYCKITRFFNLNENNA